MRKETFISLAVVIMATTTGLQAQVGINTETPKATLDVVAGKTDGTTAEGIIAPRLTLAELKSADSQYAANQNGTFVYVTDVAGSTTTKTASVTAVGYYYFDGNVWTGFKAAAYTASNGLTLSGTDVQLGGTLTKATAIDKGSYGLIVSGPGTTTLSGTGNTVISTPLQYNNTAASMGAGKVLTSDASGNATWETPALNKGEISNLFVATTGWTISSQGAILYDKIITVRVVIERTGAALPLSNGAPNVVTVIATSNYADTYLPIFPFHSVPMTDTNGMQVFRGFSDLAITASSSTAITFKGFLPSDGTAGTSLPQGSMIYFTATYIIK
jgi:hypothetical protein